MEKALPNSNPDAISNPKRDGEFEDSDSLTKKSRIDVKGDNERGNSDEAIKNEIRSLTIEAEAAEDKGLRQTMEDKWVVLSDASLGFPGKLRCAYYAIYDGHGGQLAAEYAQRHLHSNILSAGLPRELMEVKAAKRAILDGFRITDESLLQESAAGGWLDGATAVCVWVLRQTVFVANIGDAKAVLARSVATNDSENNSDGVNNLKAIVLTREHKAIYPQERARIQKAGGSVSANGRLQGRLEVSRAFGDRQFKKVGVVATPDIHSFTLTERDNFIILGCDGLWGVFGATDAVEFVHKSLKKMMNFMSNYHKVHVAIHDFPPYANFHLIPQLYRRSPQEGLPVASVTRRLVREAVRERGCKDNCTAIVIVFKNQ